MHRWQWSGSLRSCWASAMPHQLPEGYLEHLYQQTRSPNTLFDLQIATVFHTPKKNALPVHSIQLKVLAKTKLNREKGEDNGNMVDNSFTVPPNHPHSLSAALTSLELAMEYSAQRRCVGIGRVSW